MTLKNIMVDAGVLFVVFGLGMLTGTHLNRTPAAPVGAAVEVADSSPVAKVETETKDCVPVVVRKQAAKKVAALPPSVQADPDKAVLSSTDVPADTRSHRVTTVLDTSTGLHMTFDTRLPAPWLAASTTSMLGAFGGLNQDGRALRVFGAQAFAQVKGCDVSGHGSIDLQASGGRPGWFAGAGLLCRF